MGLLNSSETRVRVVFNALLDARLDGDFLPELWRMAGGKPPKDCGRLNAPLTREARMGIIFERVLPPPTRFLRWMIKHPERLQVPSDFGAKGEESVRKRKALFGSDPDERVATQREGLEALKQNGATKSGQKWWAFEGFTHVDCCFQTDKVVMFIEGKRTETVSPSTRWFKDRSQLWRNVEVAREFARRRDYAVILAVENEEDGKRAMKEAKNSLKKSYPHLPSAARLDLSKHLVGFVTWWRVDETFGLGLDFHERSRAVRIQCSARR